MTTLLHEQSHAQRVNFLISSLCMSVHQCDLVDDVMFLK